VVDQVTIGLLADDQICAPNVLQSRLPPNIPAECRKRRGAHGFSPGQRHRVRFGHAWIAELAVDEAQLDPASTEIIAQTLEETDPKAR
jgi:hypothetical protein